MESKLDLSCSSPAGVHGPSTDTSGEKKTELSGEIDDLIKADSESPTSAGTAASQEPDATSVEDELIRQETPKYLPQGIFSNKDYYRLSPQREVTAGGSATAKLLPVLPSSLGKDYDERHSPILGKYIGHHGDAEDWWSPWRSPLSITNDERQERLPGRIRECILNVKKQLKELEVLYPHVAKDHDEKHQELKEKETAGSSARTEHLMVSQGKDYDERHSPILHTSGRYHGDAEGWFSRRIPQSIPYERQERLQGRLHESIVETQPKELEHLLQQLEVQVGVVERVRNSTRLDVLNRQLKKLELLLEQLKLRVSAERTRTSIRLDLLLKKLKEAELLDEKHPELKEREATAGSSATSERLMGSLGKNKLRRRHKMAKALLLEEDSSKEMLSGVENMKAVRGNRLGSCGGETLNLGGSELSVQSESTSDDSCKILEKTSGFPALFSPLVHQGFVQYFPEKDQVQMFTPFITDDIEDETYRFQGSSPGLFQCTVTGLLFHMEGEGEVLYRIVPWNRRLLSLHHKKPAGPLFNIKCLQQSVCQLHLPHCEILSTGGGRFLSVAHIKDEGIEFIKPHDITETHVIINITGFSGFGNVKDEDSPPDPVQALVLLFYKPPDDEYPDRSSLSVLLVPRNIVIRDVRRTRFKLNGPERYIDVSPHCKLKPQQVYTLSTSPKRRVKVQPADTEFDEEIHNSFFTSFEVILKGFFKKINLSLTDKSSSSCVWEREVCLSPSTAGTTDLPSCQKLLNIRSSFIEGVSGPVLQTLLDKLLETKVMADSEVEEVKEMPHRRDKARRVLDSMRKKGEAGSSKMVEFLCEVDPFFSQHLGLMLREMEQ